MDWSSRSRSLNVEGMTLQNARYSSPVSSLSSSCRRSLLISSISSKLSNLKLSIWEMSSRGIFDELGGEAMMANLEAILCY